MKINGKNYRAYVESGVGTGGVRVRTIWVRRCRNPHPKKWTGPWFAFIGEGNVGNGMANYRSFPSYVGADIARQVFKAHGIRARIVE